MTVACAEIELALRRVNGLAGFYEQVAPTLRDAGRSRHVRSSAEARVLQEAVLVRCVSIVEALFHDLAHRLVAEHVSAAGGEPALDRLLAHLRASRLGRLGAGAWEDLTGLWRDGLGVHVTQFPAYDDLDRLRTTRNAIAHQMGAATGKYIKQNRQRLEALGLNPATLSEIPLADKDVRDALDLCREAVRWLHRQT